MSRQHWIITECKLLEDGKLMEVKFESTESKITKMCVCFDADHWCNGWIAAHKLARFEEALKEATKILEGRS